MQQNATVTELKQRYRSATNEQERREVCLLAIDQGLIKRTGPISAIDELFDTRFADKLPSEKENTKIVTVDFVRPHISSDNSIPASRTGWFLAVSYDYNGEIQNYYLTNLHK